MARRRIGQERLGVIEPDGGTMLDQVAALLDWADIERHLGGDLCGAEGRARLAAAGAVPRHAAGHLA